MSSTTTENYNGIENNIIPVQQTVFFVLPRPVGRRLSSFMAALVDVNQKLNVYISGRIFIANSTNNNIIITENG